MKRMMLNEVIPAVNAKWPEARAKRVIIQQDNAKPHVHPDDPDIVQSCQEDGWNIFIKLQDESGLHREWLKTVVVVTLSPPIVVVVTSWTDKNSGRRLWTCGGKVVKNKKQHNGHSLRHKKTAAIA
ncbi:unnamed protein product [Cuscuta campestris]|uniref:Uncharacterized protein n=1 Tax=Cuscuta campestris TaxID=132261 RepID=A0A484KCL0_9ASTE|nr:unnamed protein product [Cuscuta campestris]